MTTSDLTFYTNPMSRGRTVRWMLEEVGQPYTTEIMGYGAKLKDEAYRAVNPMGKVPALKHGDIVVTETAAICTYLADAFPQAGLAPAPGDPRRGAYLRWIFFAAGPAESAMIDKALAFEVPDDKRRMVGYGSMDDVVTALEGALGHGEYIAGPSFTTADLYVASLLGWGMMAGMMPKRPAFQAYIGRLFARPAAVKARAIDDALASAPADA